MELIFLGTGAGMPSKERNVTSIALSLLQEANSIWLFDCGEATQHQILHTTIKPRKINKIFITHMHGDHIFGLPGLLSSRSFQGGDEPLTIYGPSGIKQYIETALQLSETHVTYPLSVIEITDGKIIEDDVFTVYCKKLQHGVPSYGFRIVEKDKLGELQVDKLKAMGIPPGPIYREIKENEWIRLTDGQTVNRKDVIGPKKDGRIITILGDTKASETYGEFIKQSDLLVHEATFAKEEEELANKYLHSTTYQAASLANNNAVKKLVLTHISSRYQKEDCRRLLNEAKEIFPNTVIANDFFRISV